MSPGKSPSSVVLILSLLAITLHQAPAQSFGQAPKRISSEEVERTVVSILSKMTLEEKIDLLGGIDGFFVRDIPRLNLPRLRMADGPLGVRNFGPATAMAAGIALAASWNPALAQRVGAVLGRDARAKGVHYLLGPGVNIYRAPMNGRNFEYFGEDPFLASRVAVGYINGVQAQGVSATIKHLAGNNSEFNRHNTDSIIDERSLREIYLPVFEAAVREAKVGAIMESYNLTNGLHMSQNSFLLTDVVRKDWGFDGVMMSDWFATYDGVAAANAGLDLEMPSGAHMNREILLPAIQQGKVSVATIDEKVRRILRVAARFGWLDREQTDFTIPRFNQMGRQVALEAARESMVLLKNDGNLLPLDKTKTKSVAVIGPNAYPAVPVGGGSGRVEPFFAESFLQSLSTYLGAGVRVTYARGVPTLSELAEATNFTVEPNGQPGLRVEYFSNDKLEGAPTTTEKSAHVNIGSVSPIITPGPDDSSRWTGWFTPSTAGDYDLFVQSTGEDGGFYRLTVDDKTILDNWVEPRATVGQVTLMLAAKPHKVVLEQHGRSRWLGKRLRLGITKQGSFVSAEARRLAASADAVVIAAGFDPESETEGSDRTFRLPPGQDELIQQVSAANKNTIVALTSGGSVDMNAWLSRVPALIETWYPGQEGGMALAQVLFGEVNPSGRLPITFERRWEENPVFDSYYPQPGTNRVVYKEGVFVGYRGYERNNTKPLFPFGYGLSYTSFKYGNLKVKPLADSRYEVSFDVQNTGSRAGADVAQVYVAGPQAPVPRPAKELKGLAKIDLLPGQTKSVAVVLDNRAFSYYDVTTRQWLVTPGEYAVQVGRSSAEIELRGNIIRR